MSSVFAGGQSFKGGFRADQLSVSFGGRAVSGFLVQNVAFSYSQQVTTLYEIGSEFVYLVGGRAQGTASLSRVVGPAPFSGEFIRRFNDLCNPQDINLDSSAGCEAGAGINYTLEDAVLVTIGGSIAAQDVVISEQLQFIYLDLDAGELAA